MTSIQKVKKVLKLKVGDTITLDLGQSGPSRLKIINDYDDGFECEHITTGKVINLSFKSIIELM